MMNWIPHCLAFGLFGVITYAGPALSLSPGVVYPVKTLAAAAALLAFRRVWAREIRPCLDLGAVAAGVVVFVLWIALDPFYPRVEPDGFDPFSIAGSKVLGWCLTGVRLAGAVLVVPVMEELFWRSFAMRYLISSRFTEVPLGRFTGFSFGVVALAFGIEHHHWLPGIAAGIVYGLVLVRSGNLFTPILAHGVTNLALGIHVLATGKWGFW
jgi:CAAX prenyl protease-like protein